MSVRATRQLLDAIQGFADAYQGQDKFKDVLGQLDGLEEKIEALVPAAVAGGDPDDRSLPAAQAKATKMLKDRNSQSKDDDARTGYSQ